MNIAILGAGNVGGTLGAGLAKAGHDILYAVRNPNDPKYERLQHERCSVTHVRDAIERAETIILSTPWAQTQNALESAGDFAGKPLLDATNPIGPGFALTHGHTDSGAEQIARWAPSARIVKVFNTTGIENMAEPNYGDQGRAAMFVCGDDEEARNVAAALASDLGFEAIVVGNLSRARILEPTAMLWIHLAIVLKNGRDIALGLLTRKGGTP